MDVVKAIAALLIPPLAVGLQRGIADGHFWVNLALTLFCCWLPGVAHAVWVLMQPEPQSEL